MPLQIDIWHTGTGTASAGEILAYPASIKEGCSKMRQFKKEGKESLRMYVRDSAGNVDKNRYYYFEGNKLKFDKDDY